GEEVEAPQEALEAAALLRASRNAELTEVRARAVRDRIAPRVRHWHWMAPLGVLAATAATVIVMIAHRRQFPPRIPLPSPALLAGRAGGGGPEGGPPPDPREG